MLDYSNIEALIRKDSVHRSIYTDRQIFDMEMDLIFNKTWVFLAHACEISEEGDYKTTYIGKHPVIVARLADGSITALINRCRHRGPIVCQHEYGNSKHFRCPYHSWTYDNSGKLIGVPMPQGYGKSFNQSELGLAKVPRVAEYQGFIFGCMTEDGPSLEEHLGGITKFLDAYVAVSPTGKIDLFEGTQKCGYNGNWKYQLENGVDPYHVGALHLSAVTPEAMQIYRQGRGSVVAMDGHGVTDHTDWGPMPVDASLSGGFNLVIFPNLIVLRSQIRTVRPIAVDRTEIYTNAVRLQNVAEDVNLRRMRDQEFEFGAAGTFFTDDLEIFERTQEGLQSGAVDWVVFARGLDREEMRNGYMTGAMSDETQHRGMYQNWKRLMMGPTSPAMAAE
jgi:phenylpropionate dioxygenase-like ring-hydroxylating dioxygenase large terminal subunit